MRTLCGTILAAAVTGAFLPNQSGKLGLYQNSMGIVVQGHENSPIVGIME